MFFKKKLFQLEFGNFYVNYKVNNHTVISVTCFIFSFKENVFGPILGPPIHLEQELLMLPCDCAF